MTSARARLPALDAVRGIAILAVLAHHLTTVEGYDALSRVMSKAAHLGWAGVDLFFVLSGFLITGILIDQRDTPGRARRFYSRRARRILPVYYGTLAALLFVAPGIGALSVDAAAQSARVQSWFWLHVSNIHFAIDANMAPRAASHFWSLAVEEQFYLVWPLVVWRLPRRWLPAVCALLLVGAPLARSAHLLDSGNVFAAYVLPYARADALAAGAGLALLVRSQAGRTWLVRHSPLLTLLGATITAAVIVVSGTTWWHPLMLLAGLSALAMASAGLVGWCVTRPADRLPRALAGVATLRLLGLWSYGIYVFHLPLLVALEEWGWGAADIGQAAFYLLAGGGSVLLAAASWRWVEAPILGVRHAATRTRKAIRAA